MLDDLAHEDAAERAVVEWLEKVHEVGLLDVEAVAASVGDHVGIGVDAARFDSRLPEQPQELAAPAADVEDRSGATKVVDIAALAFADGGGRPRMRASKAK